MNDTDAMTRAINGKAGKKGTLKGRSKSGSILRNVNTDTIEIPYNVNAPITEIVITSPVLPVNKATIPIPILKTSAFTGVRKRVWSFPNEPWGKVILPNSKVDLPAASINP